MDRSIDINKAFSHLFEDPDWISKTALGALLLVAPILNFVVFGYEVRVIRNVSKGEAHPLPSWNEFGDMFIEGLWLGLARIVYGLPIFIFLFSALFMFFVAPIGGAAIFNPRTPRDADQIASLIFLLVFSISTVCCGLGIIYSLALGVLSPAITANYARQGTFVSCFNFGEIFALIRRNPSNYLMVWVTGLLGGVIYLAISSVASFLLCLNVIILWPTIFWLITAVGHAVGQFLALDSPQSVSNT